VLVEPSKHWFGKLRKNRIADIETRCCSEVSGKFIEFLETKDPLLSTIEKYRENDTHSLERNQGKIYTVETVSLNDIFKQYNLPIDIDYISIDTEGNEYEIFSTFDFAAYRFKFATIENAFDVDKSRKIQSILELNGYKKVLEEFSQFDDFYVRADYVC
jgi:FkbM family methyltransferase